VTSPSSKPSKGSVARVRALAGAALVLAVVVAAGLAGSAGAERAKVLGKTKSNAKPACSKKPAEECQITGQVTGYQRSVDGKANLFKAPSAGQIVAWSVDLARPSKKERNIFGKAAKTNEFGESPTAGIGILRKKGKRKFRLMRASPIVKVQSYYGEQPIFTLREPLRVKKGNIVALTTATWLPAFAFKGQGNDDKWVASRTKKNCEVPASVPEDQRLEYFFAHTKPHRNVGSDRKYACTYQDARLLYWAYFKPNRGGGGGGGE
jgi:hypothetical protein